MAVLHTNSIFSDCVLVSDFMAVKNRIQIQSRTELNGYIG